MKTKTKKTPKKKEERKTFVGIADCHGIEYFQGKDEPRTIPLEVRAAMFRQRHALYYEVDLTGEQEGLVREMLEKKEFSEALLYLKTIAKGVALKPEKAMVESLKLIPDPKLDPFGG